jgi:hypothetical protein
VATELLIKCCHSNRTDSLHDLRGLQSNASNNQRTCCTADRGMVRSDVRSCTCTRCRVCHRRIRASSPGHVMER